MSHGVQSPRAIAKAVIEGFVGGIMAKVVLKSTELHLTWMGQRAHATILASQKEVRQQAMAGISEEDYATVIRVLERIVQNLDGESHAEHGKTGRES